MISATLSGNSKCPLSGTPSIPLQAELAVFRKHSLLPLRHSIPCARSRLAAARTRTKRTFLNRITRRLSGDSRITSVFSRLRRRLIRTTFSLVISASDGMELMRGMVVILRTCRPRLPRNIGSTTIDCNSDDSSCQSTVSTRIRLPFCVHTSPSSVMKV